MKLEIPSEMEVAQRYIYTAYTVDTAGTLDTVYNVYYSNCFSLLKQ